MSSRKRLAVCVSTSNPSSSVTSGGGGGSLVLLCPQTGSILSSLRATGDNASRNALGIKSLSLYPPNRSGMAMPQLVMAYGGTPSKRDDTYGMLLSLRSAASSPLLHWKCRLPEAQMSAGLLISPCGNYVVGGGSTGVCHVWSALGGGALLRTVKAHYRSVSAMTWSDCGSYLVTGGADGMIHAFSLLDLVDYDMTATVAPVRTWTVHHLEVTALVTLPSGRVASSSQDGQVVILELFSEKVITKIQMPHAVSALAFHDGRLYAGAVKGSIYCLDLDVYAMHQTARLGVNVKRRRHVEDTTTADEIFSLDSSDSYKSELRGHEKSVSSLAIVNEGDGQVLLVSGDEVGVVRIWDLESRGCVRVIRPWSHSVSGATATTPAASGKPAAVPKVVSHPVTSIVVVSLSDDSDESQSSLGSFAAGSVNTKGKTSIVNLFKPLQRYADQGGKDDGNMLSVPFLRPVRDMRKGPFLEDRANVGARKRSRMSGSEVKEATPDSLLPVDEDEADERTDSAQQQDDEVARLREELAQAKATIQRWEGVNNQLLAKLQEQQQS